MKIGKTILKTTSIKNANLKALVKNIYPIPITTSNCPLCGGRLDSYTHAICVSDEECVKVVGNCCHACDGFFSTSTELIKMLDTSTFRKFASNSSLVFHYDFDYNEEIHIYEALANKLKSYFCQLTLCAPKSLRIYTIVSNKSDADPSKHILYYEHPLALDLLTAAFLKEKWLTIDKQRYSVANIYFPSLSTKELRIVPPSSYLGIIPKRNGGFYSLDKDLVPLNCLVFCEGSDRLERIQLSYSKMFDVYYVDNRLYNEFARQHGWIYATYVANEKNGWKPLRDQSLLNQFGYNVNKAEDISDSERHEILARFVEMGQKDVHYVVEFLDSLIRLNSSRCPEACAKWEQDKEFISAYKVNTERIDFIGRIKNAESTAR